MEWDRQELIDALLPLVRECGQYHCFGSTSLGSMDLSTPIKTRCNCAGEDQNKHLANQIKKMNVITKMCETIKEITNTDVHRIPSTYSDFYFLDPAENKIVIGIGPNGEITESRSYA